MRLLLPSSVTGLLLVAALLQGVAAPARQAVSTPTGRYTVTLDGVADATSAEAAATRRRSGADISHV